MPTASGAAGSRVDRGTDPGTPWPLDGLRTKTRPAGWNRDSYLERYEELQRRKKKKSKSGLRDKTEPGDEESEGAKQGSRQKDASGEYPTSGEPISGGRSKKSRLCVLL